ncbi:MAG: putative low temperature requirement protein [Mycobacterium sp.]|uniref:low temperature requirement protein A n=1 Tax=Mycobacterium sp. TaxID=1785 RepID=UPI0026030086|nr:low temperature requirement protein A [Mycobacterium sp.]MCW2663129.1 putative low temperature requirement protein [Mycobacterium sp.]
MELFFDLVFVFAMSQVTQLMLNNISWLSFGRGVLALLAVWWAWVGYTWLTNTFETVQVSHQSIVIAAMAAMLVAATALPSAFTTGALVFGVALFVVRLTHAAKFVVGSSGENPELEAGSRRMTVAFVAAPALIVVAAFLRTPYREAMWILAAVIDYGAPLVVGMGGFRVAPSYFIERHGAIIIIALGEAIVELGAGGSRNLHHPGVIAALVLGVLISATLWWTYFGLTSGAERRMQETSGDERARLARDAYSYLHLPLIAGVMFFAVGAHAAVEDVHAALRPLPALALTGGVALFYFADVAYRWRDHHQLTIDRMVTGAAALLVWPAATHLAAMAALVILTAIGVARLAWELWRRPRVGPATAGMVR